MFHSRRSEQSGKRDDCTFTDLDISDLKFDFVTSCDRPVGFLRIFQIAGPSSFLRIFVITEDTILIIVFFITITIGRNFVLFLSLCVLFPLHDESFSVDLSDDSCKLGLYLADKSDFSIDTGLVDSLNLAYETSANLGSGIHSSILHNQVNIWAGIDDATTTSIEYLLTPLE